MVSYMHIYKRRPRNVPKTKKEWWLLVSRTLIVILGTFVVAFGNVAFLVPMDINAGGLNGIAIIFRYFINNPQQKVLIYNIVIDVCAVFFWLMGLLFIGKDFAIKTLVATIAFPAANWFFTACPGVSDFASSLGEMLKNAGHSAETLPTAGNYLFGGIFGGVFVGAGVAITFVGGGSTGGVDVLTFMMEKFAKIKQSIASFIVDGTIITLGLIILLPNNKDLLLPCLSGIVSAFMSAVLIEVIYIGSQSSYQVDIISSKWEEIQKYAQDELERGTTIIPCRGGFKGEERVILRVVFDRRQFNKIRSHIAKIDPHAFVTYTRTNAVYGEGFKDHNVSSPIDLIKKDKNDGK